VRDHVGGEGVQRQGDHPADRTGQIAGEREHHQAEQQRQHDHREPGREQHAVGVVAVLVQQVAGDGPLGGAVRESGRWPVPGVQARVREREPARHDQFGERGVLGVVRHLVLAQVRRGGGEIDRLVDGRGLLDGRGDHGDCHRGEEQRHHRRRPEPPNHPAPARCRP
jgi:hypothetical protein